MLTTFIHNFCSPLLFTFKNFCSHFLFINVDHNFLKTFFVHHNSQLICFKLLIKMLLKAFVNNFCSERLFTICPHHFCSQPFFTSFVHNLYSQFLFFCFIHILFQPHQMITISVCNFCSQQLFRTFFFHKFCSQPLLKTFLHRCI